MSNLRRTAIRTQAALEAACVEPTTPGEFATMRRQKSIQAGNTVLQPWIAQPVSFARSRTMGSLLTGRGASTGGAAVLAGRSATHQEARRWSGSFGRTAEAPWPESDLSL
jgi:hypothetical protein